MSTFYQHYSLVQNLHCLCDHKRLKSLRKCHLIGEPNEFTGQIGWNIRHGHPIVVPGHQHTATDPHIGNVHHMDYAQHAICVEDLCDYEIKWFISV